MQLSGSQLVASKLLTGRFLTLSCFHITPHGLAQTEQALARLSCFGMIFTKCLCSHRMCKFIEGFCLLMLAPQLLGTSKLVQDLSRFGVLVPHGLFADRQGTSIERLCLLILALFTVQRSQAAERISQIGMLMQRWDLLTNTQRALEE